MYAVNSKFKKKLENSKKYEIFWHQRGWGAQGACKFLLCFDTVGARGEKNYIWRRKNSEKCTILFFC